MYYYKAHPANFGDDLNPLVLNHYFSGIIDDEAWHCDGEKNYTDTDELLVGIGTLLSHWVPVNNKKFIFSTGSGYGQASPLPNTEIFCVRGPLTAKKYNLDSSLAITDGAALLSRMGTIDQPKRYKKSFMPHYSTAQDGDWRWVCDTLGINYIDPRGDALETIASIKATEILYAEAMHGAIVADALRVPWVPIKTSSEILDFKWMDWAGSLNLEVQFHKLPSIWDAATITGKIRSGMKKIFALKQLNSIVRSDLGVLSSDVILNDRVDRLEDAARRLKIKLTNR